MIKKVFTFLLFTLSLLSFAQKSALKKELKKIIDGKNATVAVSVLSLDDAHLNLNINGDKKLPMQSVFKFHIALAVLDRVDKGEFKLDGRILIARPWLLENTWSPMREQLPPKGNVKTLLSRIIKFTVADSDNNGADILMRLIGGTPEVQKFMNSKDVKDFSIKFNEEEMHKVNDFQYQNYTTTNSMNNLLKKFYDQKIVSKTSTEFLMKTMEEASTGKNRLIAQLPENTVVAHKTGTSATQNGVTAATNDAGIVTLPNGKHYAISVFVSDSKEDEATNEKIIADISKTVWDYFIKRK